MACENCDHTLQLASVRDDTRIYWCSRCGTLRTVGFAECEVLNETPQLVLRCRQFEAAHVASHELPDKAAKAWRTLGLEESINVPADRPT